jgi:hypothetical protein
MRWALLVVALTLAMSRAGAAEETTAEKPATASVLSWESGVGKSYLIPAGEIAAFIFGLNQVDRHAFSSRDYDSDLHTAWRNLRTAPVFDADPFSVNQIGHPYQGSIYYGLARSAGLNYWQSLLYTIGGSFLWETAGERVPPLHQRPRRDGDRRDVRGRGRVQDGQPAARGRRRQARVLA